MAANVVEFGPAGVTVSSMVTAALAGVVIVDESNAAAATVNTARFIGSIPCCRVANGVEPLAATRALTLC